jgi:SMC interacting uncharacterized protein involved in chromosome segregation
MRRTTLGPIVGSDLNNTYEDLSTSTVGGASNRQNKPTNLPSTGKKPQINRRMSAAQISQPNMDRRASVTSKTGSILSMNRDERETRPVKEKSFQESTMENLIKFLSETGYQQRVAMKMLASPTGKDFTNIISFLFRLIDPKFELMKMEDDVQMIYKALRYVVSFVDSFSFQFSNSNRFRYSNGCRL